MTSAPKYFFCRDLQAPLKEKQLWIWYAFFYLFKNIHLISSFRHFFIPFLSSIFAIFAFLFVTDNAIQCNTYNISFITIHKQTSFQHLITSYRLFSENRNISNTLFHENAFLLNLRIHALLFSDTVQHNTSLHCLRMKSIFIFSKAVKHFCNKHHFSFLFTFSFLLSSFHLLFFLTSFLLPLHHLEPFLPR